MVRCVRKINITFTFGNMRIPQRIFRFLRNILTLNKKSRTCQARLRLTYPYLIMADKTSELQNIPRGKPKSGRVWKNVRNQRFSDIKQVKSLKSSWSEKMKKRAEMKSIKDYEKRLKDERTQELEEKRKRKEEKEKRRLENERKSEITQTIKNTSKIKRMKKKQLRLLAKR